MQIGNELKGKVALVTGSSRGIGRATAVLFGQEGIKVGVNYFGSEEASNANDTVQEIRRSGGDAIALHADVADGSQVMTMVERLVAHYAPVDILVNNAGTHAVLDFLEITEEQWDRLLAVHLKGMFNCTRAVLGPMLDKGYGRIVNVASDLGIAGGARMTHYCTAKGGMIAFTKALGREVASRGVKVNSVAPGPILTQMLTSNPNEYNEEARMSLPARRFGTPQEVAQSILFLASSAGDFYVGQVLGMNGGTVI